MVARQPLGHYEELQCRLPQDLARKAETLDRALAVIGIGPIVWIDQGSGFRIPLAMRTVPRDRGRRKAEFSVTPGFFIEATPASMPEPKPKWNWMSGDRAPLSAYQNPPVSKSVEVTGPVLNRRYWSPAQIVR